MHGAASSAQDHLLILLNVVQTNGSKELLSSGSHVLKGAALVIFRGCFT
jgi:hypothetical protein